METNLPQLSSQIPEQALAASKTAAERLQAVTELMLNSALQSLPPLKRFMANQFLGEFKDDIFGSLEGASDELVIKALEYSREMTNIVIDAIKDGVNDELRERMLKTWGDLRGISETKPDSIGPDPRD